MKIHSLSFTSLTCISLLTIGCSKDLQLESTRWSTVGPAPAPPAGVNRKKNSVSIGERNLILQKQTVNGVDIEESYYKELGDAAPEFIASKWAAEIPITLRTEVMRAKAQAHSVVGKFFQKYPDFNRKDLIQKPSLVIRSSEVQWKFIFQDDQGSLVGIFLNSALQFRERRNLGSHVDVPTATLFPDGPLKSHLQKVLLEDLIGNRTLTSAKIRVSTQASVTAEAENFQFLFPIEDKRFDQVQVFFYLSKALLWCENILKFELPFAIEAETSIGFPEKTNAAFYYQHKIRLGDGDDSVFSRIALDPSIVIHESFHAVIEAVANLPFEGEGGSLNEGLADLFTAALLNNPKLGEASYKKAPFKRTVENALSFSERNGGLYHDSGIVSGLFWSLQESLGRDVGIKLTWEVLLHLKPDSDFADLNRVLQEMVSKLPKELKLKAQNVLDQRGWSE
jgi:hypothetical protein